MSERETLTPATTCTLLKATVRQLPLTYLICSHLYLGIGSYMNWDEPTRVKWLKEELDGKRPLIRTSDIGK
jgi:hypothetical protein